MAAPVALMALAGAVVLLMAARPPTRGAGSSAPMGTRTGGDDARAWTLARWTTARDILAAQGMPLAQAGPVAAALLAHWAIETGHGHSEWGFNVGNVKAFQNWTGAVQRLPDGLSYRAFSTARDGVADSIGLAQSGRYRAAWDYLTGTGDGAGWYDRLMRAGWHPWSAEALNTYRGTRETVRERVGV